MPQQQMGSFDINFVDSRKATPVFYSGVSAPTNPITNYAETEDLFTISQALNTFDPITYSTANIELLNANDLLFAWRACRGNQASISDYHPAQIART